MGILNVHKHQHNHKTKLIYLDQHDIETQKFISIFHVSKIRQAVARYCGAQPEGMAESEGPGHCTQAHGFLGSREGAEAEVEDVRKPGDGLEGEDNGGDRVVQADRGNFQPQKPNDQSPLATAVLDSGIEQTAGS